MDPTPFVNPPLYSAIAITTAFAIIFGVIFKDMLEYRVADWQINRETQDRIGYNRPELILMYLATCLALFGFLTACFAVIGISLKFAAIIASVMILSTGGLIWWQLGSLLQLLVVGGSAAIDIDSYGAGQPLDSQGMDQG